MAEPLPASVAPAAPSSSDAPPVRNPYPGLRPFRTDEQHLFFGRERQIDRMVNKLAARRFLAVVGSSASGKSSLVNCGLRPALHRGFMPGAGSDWRMASMRPGHDPVDALAQTLAAPGVLFDKPLSAGMSTQELIDGTLRMGSLGLVDIVEQARLPAQTRLLLVVDQFEELFRFHGGEAKAPAGAALAPPQAAHSPGTRAQTFVKLLLEAVAQTELPIYIVLTMRSDYLGDCAQFEGLSEAMNESQYLVPRLTRDEIRAAITGPVAMADVRISPLLLTRLLNDVGDNPDQLSILQHALNRSFAHWENEGGAQGELDLAHYEAIGTMVGALDLHAEKAFWELSDVTGAAALSPTERAAPALSPRQMLAQRLFRAITDKGTDPRGIRRPTALHRLCDITGASQDELEVVMAVFRRASRSFLMPPEGEPLKPGARIDISHESLMRVWKRLVAWSDQEASASRQYRRLAESATLYDRGQIDLMTDRELELALEWRRNAAPNAAWAEQYGGQFEAVSAFINASQAVKTAERIEVELERRWRSTWRVVAIVVAVVLFLVGQREVAGMIQGPLERLLTGSPLDVLLQNHAGKLSDVSEILAHLAVGVPVLAAFGLIESFGRRLHERLAMPAISRELARVAQAPPTPLPAPLPKPALSGPASATATATASDLADTSALAPHGRRLAARLIDWSALLAMSFTALVVIAAVDVAIADVLSSDVLGWLFFATLFLGGWVYAAWRHSSPVQATLGLRWMGLIVTDEAGQRLSFARASARHWAKTLSYVPYGLGCLAILFTKRRQALHDKLCKTLVLRRAKPAKPAKPERGPHPA